MDIGSMMDKFSNIVIDAVRKKEGKDINVKMFRDLPNDRMVASLHGFAPVPIKTVQEFYPDFPKHATDSYAHFGEMVYMWRDQRLQDEEEREFEALNVRRSGAATAQMKDLGHELKVPVLTETS